MGDSIEAQDPLVGKVVAERYRVERRLGQGGMGTVYVAEHLGIGKRVALKCLNPEYAMNGMVVERFLREARLATAAGNEHIVDVTDLGKLPDGAPFLVMELLEGRELGDALEQDGPFVIGRAVRILRQACDALAAAHEKGIVHRDLKPDNLFLAKRTRENEFVKVLDFGISKLTENDKVQKLTGTGMTLGTPHYMSPEQAQGLPSVDHRTDVYALGVILYELLVGALPFDEETFPMLVVAIVTRDAPSARLRRRDVPFELDAVIQRCLAKDPEIRPQSVQELADLLAPFESIEGEPELVAAAPTLRPGVIEQATAVGKKTPSAGQATGELVPSEGTAPTERMAGKGAPPRVAMFVLGVGIALVGAAGVVWATRGEPQAPPESVQTPPTTPPTTPTETPDPPPETPPPTTTAMTEAPVEAAEEVRLRILVSPSDAKLFLDDVEFPNPLDVRRARRENPLRVRIEREGYATVEELVVLDRDVELLRTLDRATTMRASQGGTTNMQGATMEGTATDTSMDTSTMDTSTMDGFRDDF
ncbi:MAG: serine/threonine protein kinase [Sandaracinus sp.]|nr:serine/threonine protein kinase [Sandaracinus sp.]